MRHRTAALQALLALLALCVPSDAIFEEQAGAFDWGRVGVGQPRKVFHLPNALVVHSELGVVASLALRDGRVNWRFAPDQGAAAPATARRVGRAARGDAHCLVPARRTLQPTTAQTRPHPRTW